jgi:hypothetical protein
MRKSSDDTYGEENTHFMVKTLFLSKQKFIFSNFSENCAVYEIVWKNVAEPDWPQTTV